jgi:hypothetical protein
MRIVRCDDRVWFRDDTHQWHADEKRVLVLLANAVCDATACHHCRRLEWHAYALVGTTALIGTTYALTGPPAVVKTSSAHNALPLLLG